LFFKELVVARGLERTTTDLYSHPRVGV